MRRNRGSALAFVLIMAAVVSTAILASVQLCTSAGQVQSKREAEVKARYAFEGAIQKALTAYRQGLYVLPQSMTYAVGDQSVKLDLTDNGGALARTVKVDAVLSITGMTFKFSRVTGNRLDPNPFQYAMFVNGNLDPTKTIALGSGGANGDLCVNGTITARANAFTINGDLETKGTTLPFGAVIKGNTFTQMPALTVPALNSALYAAAGPVNLGLSALSGFGFPVADPYQLYYKLGDLDIKGLFTGKGTIFVVGDVNIKGDVTYGAANSRLVVLATGRIRSDAGAKNIVGFWWSGTEFDNDDDLVVGSGSIVAPVFTLDKTLAITHDPAFWDSPSEAVKHRVPGFWP